MEENNCPSEKVIKSNAIEIGNIVKDPEAFESSSKSFSKQIVDKISAIKWSNVIIVFLQHLLLLVSVLYFLVNTFRFYTLVWTIAIGFLSGMGLTIGAHRLWAHRSFKATTSLRLLLAVFQSMTLVGSAFAYARDHRTHHKYTDSDLDPKNPSRGLFYAHIGWWFFRKSPKVIEAGKKLDFQDLLDDRVLWLQHRFYPLMFVIFGLTLPTIIPYYGWTEDIATSFLINIFRITLVSHHFFTVNSIAHFFGHRPYDFRIRPTENRLVIYLSLGEGNHNYHHVFPWDYRSCDKKAWESFNPSTLMIDFLESIGMAYDLKIASDTVVQGTIERKGLPNYFDPPRGLMFRILNGILDWILGTATILWPLFCFILIKLVTKQTILYF